MKWKSLLIVSGLMLLAIFILFQTCLSCKRPHPIPKDKQAFIGLWHSRSGFQMKINPSGTADVIPIYDSQNPDFDKLFLGITIDYAKDMIVGFEGDTMISFLKPHVRYKAYRIDRDPYLDGDTIKMILNGVVLIKDQ